MSKQKRRGLAALLGCILIVSLACSLQVDLGEPTPAASTPDVDRLTAGAPTLPAQATTPADNAADADADEEGIAVFFSSALEDDGPDAETAFVAAVRGAQDTIDMAIYNISLDSLADALVDAHRRGVTVRLVMESEARERRVPSRLTDAGIPIVGDQREGLMHNKFTIIDGREVWLGSMNYTSASFHDDINNLVRMRSREMAQNYTAAFEEMFTEKRFGSDKLPNTPFPSTEVGGIPVQVAFSPDDGVAAQVVGVLYRAEERIDFLAYSFTRDDFAAAMLGRAETSGVRVRGVFDAEQVDSNTGGEFDKLKRASLDVRRDGSPGLLHDKVIIIDAEIVITGSYNFSGNAERTNDENLVIIYDAGIAQEYLEHFEQVYAASR